MSASVYNIRMQHTRTHAYRKTKRRCFSRVASPETREKRWRDNAPERTANRHATTLHTTRVCMHPQTLPLTGCHHRCTGRLTV